MSDICVAARLAVSGPKLERGIPVQGGYHGRSVIVRALSSSGFEAECGFSCPEGSIVRLKVPFAGVAIARVTRCHGDRVSADFVNPVAVWRIANSLGVDAQRLAAA